MESSNKLTAVTNFELALKYADAGLSVFPASDISKRPVLTGDWRDHSTDEVAKVSNMWADRPCAAVGVDCGKSGLLIIDLDRNHKDGADGVAVFGELAKAHGGIPDVPRVLTPNGGVHIYFKQPTSSPLGNSKGYLPAGIDVRGVGGYVIGCGTVMADGRKYEHDPSSPRLSEAIASCRLQEPPEWLLQLIRPARVSVEKTAPTPFSPRSSGDEARLLEDALPFIPADDRDTWLKVGGALHDSDIPNARQIWDDWSRVSSKFDARDQESTWRSFGRSAANKARLGTIFYEAQQRGFVLHSGRPSGVVRKVEGTAPANKFTLEPFDDIRFDANESWLVKGLLPQQGTAVIYGEPGTYKSFVVLDISLAVATGQDWGGRVVEGGPVVYIAAEGAHGLRKRIEGIRQSRGLSAGLPLHLISAAPDLGSPHGDLEPLAKSIEASGVNPRLIVVDTLACTLNSADENGAGMVQFTTNAGNLARRFNALVLVVHHSALSAPDRERGHTSLRGGVDARCLCEKGAGGLAARLTFGKIKDEASGIVMTAALKRIVLGYDEDGDEISTLVVEAVSDAEPQSRKIKCAKVPPSLRLIIDLVGEATLDHGETIRPWTDSPAIKAAAMDDVKRLYLQRKPVVDEDDPARGRDNQRRAFKSAVDKAVDRKLVISEICNGKTFLWLPSTNEPGHRTSGPRTGSKEPGPVRSGFGSDNGFGPVRTRSDLVRSGPVVAAGSDKSADPGEVALGPDEVLL